MKIYTLILLMAGNATLSSCDHHTGLDFHKMQETRVNEAELFKKPVKEQPFFASGKYVTYQESAFCSFWDTLSISKKKDQINVYQIVRRSSFRTNLNDQYFKPQYHHKTTLGSYDPTRKTMELFPNGYTLAFNPETATLELDEMEYQKIE